MAKTIGLSDFLKSKAHSAQDETALTPMDWQDRKKKWLKRIDDLYGQVRNWLESLEKETILSFVDSEISLDEPAKDL